MKTNLRYLLIVCLLQASLLLVQPRPCLAQSYRGEKPEWVLQIGGPNDDVSSWRIAVDNDGSAIVAGMFQGSISIGSRTLFAMSKAYTDVFVAKVSPVGEVVWVTQIGGDKEEKVWSNRLAIDDDNSIYLTIFTSSEYLAVGTDTIYVEPYNGHSERKPRILKLRSNGVLSHFFGNQDIQHGGDGGIERSVIHLDRQGNILISDTPNNPFGAFLVKYDREGRRVFLKNYGNPQLFTLLPRIQAYSSGAEGNHYMCILYSDKLSIEDSNIAGYMNDVLLVKMDAQGNILWLRSIEGPKMEEVVATEIVGNELVCYGYFGEPFSKVPVDFGGKTLSRTVENYNAFRARYNLVTGTLIDVEPLQIQLPNTNLVDIEYTESLTKVAVPKQGMIEYRDNVRTQYYFGQTYSLTSVCGGHYLTGEFTDSLRLGSNRLSSRGGKDLYLAFLRPPEKYVPVRPGSRFPLDNSVDLDIPVRTEWWPVSCASGYRFQLSRDSAMTSVVLDTVMPLDPFLNLDRLEPLTKYYWRLRANTSDTFSVWSDTRSFTTVKAQPADVVLEYPANDSKGLTRGVTLRWQVSKRATTYLVDIATDSAFSNKVVNGRLITTNTFDAQLEARRTYYWRVRAGNAAGTSPWSTVWKFDVKPDKPVKIVLDQPINGAQGEPLNTLLGWKGISDATQYTVQVARDSSMAFVEVEKTVPDAFWRGDFEGNTTYFWRVRGSNGIEQGDWSSVWSFATSNTTGVSDDNSDRDLTATYIDGAILVHINNEKLLNQDVKIALYELSGREVMSARMRVDGSPLRVAVPNLSRGVYVLRLTANDDSLIDCRVVVD